MALFEGIQPASTLTQSNGPAFNKPKEGIVTSAPDTSGEQSAHFQIVDEDGIQALSFPDLKIEDWDALLEEERESFVSYPAKR